MEAHFAVITALAVLVGLYAVPITLAAAWPWLRTPLKLAVQWLRVPLLTIAAVAAVALVIIVYATMPPLTTAGAILVGALLIAIAISNQRDGR